MNYRKKYFSLLETEDVFFFKSIGNLPFSEGVNAKTFSFLDLSKSASSQF